MEFCHFFYLKCFLIHIICQVQDLGINFYSGYKEKEYFKVRGVITVLGDLFTGTLRFLQSVTVVKGEIVKGL